LIQENTIHLKRKTPEEELRWENNIFHIVSFPRSGSHWVRRMLGEITAIRSGLKGAAFGSQLNTVAGFTPPCINDCIVEKLKTPYFRATHGIENYNIKTAKREGERVGPDHIDIYLRRNFEAVYKSTCKAAQEMKKCFWAGTREEVYAKWKGHVELGCALADVVLDYEVVKADPAIVLHLVDSRCGLKLTDEEIACAVEAGTRENMLKEQEVLDKRTWNIINSVNYEVVT